MGIGLILAAAGLLLLLPVGNDGQGLIADPVQRFDSVAVLVTAGVSLLLTSRRPLAFWLVLTIVGSIGYITEQSNPWAPPGWHNRVVLISVVLFAAATLLSAVPAPRSSGAALLLTGVIGGILFLGEQRPGLVPWGDEVHAFLVDAFFLMATVVVVLWLRDRKRSRAGFVLTVSGITAYALEQTSAWAPAGWHNRIAVMAAIAAIIGIVAAIADDVGRKSYGMAFVAGTGWGIGAIVARHQQQWQSYIGPRLAGVLDIVSTGLLVVAVTALVCFTIQVATEALRQFREQEDERNAYRVPEFCIGLILVSGGGFLLAAIALAGLRVFDQNRLGAFGLGLLTVAGLASGFAAGWIALAAAADLGRMASPPRDRYELATFVAESVIDGPRDLGPGPVVAFSGTALLLICAIVFGATPAWLTLGLAGGALVVVGAALSSARFLQELAVRAERDPGLVRLSPTQLWQQQKLASRAVAAGGIGIVLLFLVHSETVPIALRFLLSLAAIAGFVVAASEAPVHLLVALQGTRDDVGWTETKNDRRLRRPTRVALAGLIASVTATVWVTSFPLDTWQRTVLTLTAIAGFCVVFAFGVLAIVTVTETIRTGDRTVAHRAERIAATKGNLYRLLPAPRRAAHDLRPEWDLAEEAFDFEPPR
ncbi:hypothetical protein ACFQS1_32390 [Paractinoplanes rhizophilus]|uniref:Uncharacterized protein n=1 Tax=Paractinoplanes rhizophilus TaxID=1416877 RepID=A0ABW2I1F5_9ACTN